MENVFISGPDQAQHFDLGPNCLQNLSADGTSQYGKFN